MSLNPVSENARPTRNGRGQRISWSHVDSVLAALATGATIVEVANLCGVSDATVSLIRHGCHRLQKERRGIVTSRKSAPSLPPSYLPTPDEIAAACKAIRAARPIEPVADDEPEGWTPPTFAMAAIYPRL